VLRGGEGKGVAMQEERNIQVFVEKPVEKRPFGGTGGR